MSICTQAMHTDYPNFETFHQFFDSWLLEQDKNLQQLISAANNHQQGSNNDNAFLSRLVDGVVGHYELYYQAKSKWARHDTLCMFSPTWLSTLEDAFLWIGGWRPTVAFHLLYSKSGIQLEAKLAELIRGMKTGDLGDLTPSQLKRIDELQKKTISEERVITEKMAKMQESVADKSMVELSNAVSEMIRSESGECGGGNYLESTLDSKKDGLEELLHMADDLRLKTLKAVIEILTPIQAVHFLIAAAELHLRLHDWGKKIDANLAIKTTATYQHQGNGLQNNQVR